MVLTLAYGLPHDAAAKPYIEVYYGELDVPGCNYQLLSAPGGFRTKIAAYLIRDAKDILPMHLGLSRILSDKTLPKPPSPHKPFDFYVPALTPVLTSLPFVP